MTFFRLEIFYFGLNEYFLTFLKSQVLTDKTGKLLNINKYVFDVDKTLIRTF
jgi:hypothetical protein